MTIPTSFNASRRRLLGGVAWGSLAGCALPGHTQPASWFDDFDQLDNRRWYVSNGWANGDHQSCEWSAREVRVADSRLQLWLTDRKARTRALSCGELQSRDRLGFGRYEARIRTAAGSGLNSAFFTYTGPPHGVKDHDEIDMEFLGKSPRKVELNVWRAGKPLGPWIIDLGFDASEAFHDYAFDWQADRIVWYVDAREVHRTAAHLSIPTVPQKLYFSLWSAGAGSQQWMGPHRFDRPSLMEVESTRFTRHGPR